MNKKYVIMLLLLSVGNVYIKIWLVLVFVFYWLGKRNNNSMFFLVSWIGVFLKGFFINEEFVKCKIKGYIYICKFRFVLIFFLL